MNSMKKIVSAIVIATTALATLGSAAQAGDYGGGYGHGGYGHGGYGAAPGYGHGPGYGHHAPAPQPYYGGNYHRRDRTGEKIATGVAIGVGALILGSILANQGRRHHGY